MNVPKLRFKDENGQDFPAWEEKSLLDLSSSGFSNGVFNDPNKIGSGYKLINVLDMYIDGFINENNLTLIALSENEFLKNKVEYGDIFFTRSSLVKEGIAHSNIYLRNSDDVTFDGHLIRMQPKKELVNSIFLYYALKTSQVRCQLIIRGKTGTMTTIGQADIATVMIAIPSLPEQTKIANFLSAVDDKISEFTKKVELLQRYKKGVMQQIFSQQLRFKDDNGQDFPEWEENILGELGMFFSGGTPLTSRKDFYNGNIPFIKSGELGLTSTAQTITELGLKNSSAKIVNAGDLLYALYGATSGELAISKITGAINQAVLCIRTSLNTYFLYYYLLFKKQSILKTYLQGGQGNLSAEIVKSLAVLCPLEKEQTKIANFLSALDEQINISQQQLDSTKQYKKSLLQQMFI